MYCSKLSGGLFFFFSPLSTPGYLLSRMVRQIPYLHLGNSWAHRNKYEGTGVSQTMHGEGAFRDSFLYRFCCSWTRRLFLGSFFCMIYREDTNSRLADLRLPCAKSLIIHRRRRCYQSMSTLSSSDRMSSIFVCRRSQPIVLGFPSPCFDIGY